MRGGVILVNLVVLTLLGGVVYVSVTGHGQGTPEIDKAPFTVMTFSHIEGKALPLRIFYGDKYTEVNGEPALDGWWAYDGKRYVYHGGTKVFKKAEWGAVTVIRRNTK